MKTLIKALLVIAWVFLPQGVLFSQTPEPTPAETVPDEPASTRELLDAIREDLVQLRFEKALAALEPLLVRPGLSDDERVEAMVLRSQTHAAFGDNEAAEEDYRQILLRRPSWSPDTSLTPTKAMRRYESVRDKLIGRVRFLLDPADSMLVIDDAEVSDALLPIALLAGIHEIQVARRGHDPVAQTVDVEAGESIDLEISLIPNARTVILRTEPEDVEVWLDDVFVGLTKRTETFVGVGSDAAELVIEDVPIGEHRFEFRKECRRTERVVDSLNVDLLDRAPKRYDTVRLAESNVLMTPRGGPSGTRFRVDGVEVATLPTDVIQACPGQRLLEAVYEDRVLWSERMELVAAVPVTLTIRPRPNIALVGMDDLPRELAALVPYVNVTTVSPHGEEDLSTPDGWDRLNLGRDVDLAIAPAGDARQGMAGAWRLYSPVLRTLAKIVDLPDASEPPWSKNVWGLVTADDGSPLIVERLRGTGNPVVGSRMISIAGEEVANASAVVAAFASADAPAAATWQAADGTAGEGSIGATESRWLLDRPPAGVTDMFRAAWAVVASESNVTHSSSALANLALLFASHGDHELALRTWRRVKWTDRAGIGSGTVDYYVGRELQALGRDADAVEALRRAAHSQATAVSDEGPPVAPAARDRLADLGESP